jgi:hypothetical protein
MTPPGVKPLEQKRLFGTENAERWKPWKLEGNVKKEKYIFIC